MAQNQTLRWQAGNYKNTPTSGITNIYCNSSGDILYDTYYNGSPATGVLLANSIGKTSMRVAFRTGNLAPTANVWRNDGGMPISLTYMATGWWNIVGAFVSTNNFSLTPQSINTYGNEWNFPNLEYPAHPTDLRVIKLAPNDDYADGAINIMHYRSGVLSNFLVSPPQIDIEVTYLIV